MKPIIIPQIKGLLNYYSRNRVKDMKHKVRMVVSKYDDSLVKSGSLRRLLDDFDETFKILLSNTLYIGSAYSSRTPVSNTYKSLIELEPLFKLLSHHSNTPTQVKFKFGESTLTIRDAKVSNWIKNRLLVDLKAMALPAEFKDLRFFASAIGDQEVMDMLKERATRKPLTEGAAYYTIVQSVRTYLDKKVTLTNGLSCDLTAVEAQFFIELFVAIDLFGNEFIDSFTNAPSTSKAKNFLTSLNRWHHKSLKDSITYP